MGPPEPSPHPGPPPDLHALPLPLKRSSRAWIRIHGCGRHSIFFGRTTENRWDAPNGEFGVLYAGEDDFCAFIEVFGDPLELRTVSWRDLAYLCVSRLSTRRPLRCADLTGEGLRRIRADARLTSGPRHLAQQWALALWSHPTEVDGIVYRARHDPSKEAIALFDRAKNAIVAARPRKLTAEADRLSQIFDRYGFGVVE